MSSNRSSGTCVCGHNRVVHPRGTGPLPARYQQLGLKCGGKTRNTDGFAVDCPCTGFQSVVSQAPRSATQERNRAVVAKREFPNALRGPQDLAWAFSQYMVKRMAEENDASKRNFGRMHALIDAIESGKMDRYLDVLADAMNKRYEALDG